ncbi:MAG: hypothetical protein M0R32_10515 [Candidatus Cloacimonetes bacterium]|jgi:hypothetical protein|nr:hypothetical protein [Candidatus Cloacimonadota bacterium]
MKTETVTVQLFPGATFFFECENPSRLENFVGRTLPEQAAFEESQKGKTMWPCLEMGPYRRKWQWELSKMLKKASEERFNFERVLERRD